jgi:type II secretory pathway predicted ATPase ExeA
MIRSYFGLDRNPFCQEPIQLLPRQQEIFDTLRVHSQQGGLCLLLGEPGAGKSVIKEALCRHDPKRMITPVLNRTLHTYFSTLRILCEAFQIDTQGESFRCEKRLIEEAQRLNHLGKMLVPILDDAHLMEIDSLRRLRLLFEDFPKNHNLVLIAQPTLLSKLSLTANEDIQSRVTYSVLVPKLAPEEMTAFILDQLDRVALAHSTFTPEALDLIVRSSEGILRRARNLCLGTLVEAVRDRTKTVDLKQVNRVLLQPHWRREYDWDQG